MRKRVQHIALSSDIRAAFGTGEKVRAICGRKFAPMNEGDWTARICEDCARIHGSKSLTPYRTTVTFYSPLGSFYYWRPGTQVA